MRDEQDHPDDVVLVRVNHNQRIRENRIMYVGGQEFTCLRGRAKSLAVTIIATVSRAATAAPDPPSPRVLRGTRNRLQRPGLDRGE